MTSELAAIAAFFVAFSEHMRDKPLPAGIFVGLSVVLFWYGAYEAWTKKLRELEKSQQHIVELETRLTENSEKKQSPHTTA